MHARPRATFSRYAKWAQRVLYTSSGDATITGKKTPGGAGTHTVTGTARAALLDLEFFFVPRQTHGGLVRPFSSSSKLTIARHHERRGSFDAKARASSRRRTMRTRSHDA